MKSLKDKFYIKKQSKKFKEKGESNLEKLKSLVSNLNEWEKRAKMIKEGILKGSNLYPLPKKTPLNAIIHSKRTYDGYQVENVYFESIPGFYVTGCLYQPLSVNEKIPVLLKPHGHLKNKRYNIDNQSICANFARMGVRVFTYDMIGYACSFQVKHHISSALTLQTWNSIRSLDFLLSLDYSDPERVGCTGGSGGGTQTFIVTALDDRIRFSCPCVMVSSFFYGGCVCESGLPIHKREKYSTNNAEIAGLAAPRPQLLISVGGDWTRMTPKWEYPFIKRIYDFYGKESLVENAHFPDEVHNYGPSKRQAAYKFFTKYFKINVSSFLKEKGLFDESQIIEESEDMLKVFNADHPHPSNALKSESDILEKIKELQN